MIRVFPVLVKHQLATYLQYRAYLIIGMVSGILPLFMALAWRSVLGASEAQGYDAISISMYFVGVFFVQQATFAWVVFQLENQIRHGSLSYKLLRPLDPYWEHLADNISEKLVRLPLAAVPLLVLGVYVFGTELPPSRVALFVSSVLAAWLIRFEMQYIFGIMSFWTDKASALENVWYSSVLVFSGALAPLVFFPGWAQDLLSYTPFPYLIDFPVSVLLGTGSTPLLDGFAAQLSWLVGLVAFRAVAWRSGLRRFGAVGG